jgi:hypothetical protein
MSADDLYTSQICLNKNKMKTNEIIQIAVMVALAAALLYRKYGKKKKTDERSKKNLADKSLFSSQSTDEEYEPYSKKNSNE